MSELSFIQLLRNYLERYKNASAKNETIARHLEKLEIERSLKLGEKLP